MVKPATQRRRNKVYQQQLQQQQAQQAQQAQKQKEDDAGGMHDEADVMSFRSAATHRFILNQELIENVTEKWVHTDSIIRPKPFAQFQTPKENIDEIKDELYFGNVNLMRQKAEKLQKEVDEIKLEHEKVHEKSSNVQIRELISQLSETFVKNDASTVEGAQETFQNIVQRKIINESYTIKAIPKIKNDTSEAPANYWEDLKKAKEDESTNNHLVISDQGYMQEDNTQTAQEQLQYVEAPPAFAADDMNMIDDVGFGLHSTLDDQDFLSQIDHSME